METYHVIIAVLLVIAVQVGALVWLGHPALCRCESLKVWDGAVRSTENSQHLLDWYSFSHFISGFLVYFLLWIARKKFGWPKSIVTAFLILIVISASWEIFENTHYAIRRFQENTISYDYHGDSVANALMDTAAMSLGFWLAFYLPLWASIALIVIIEGIMIAVTRDGLILHSLMFTYPIQFIFDWQASLTY